MHNSRSRLSLSAVTLCASAVAVLATAYIGLIAVVMSSAALTMEFAQSVKNDEAVVAVLESQYLAAVAHLTGIDYVAAGYATPRSTLFVPATSVTALR